MIRWFTRVASFLLPKSAVAVDQSEYRDIALCQALNTDKYASCHRAKLLCRLNHRR